MCFNEINAHAKRFQETSTTEDTPPALLHAPPIPLKPARKPNEPNAIISKPDQTIEKSESLEKNIFAYYLEYSYFFFFYFGQ